MAAIFYFNSPEMILKKKNFCFAPKTICFLFCYLSISRRFDISHVTREKAANFYYRVVCAARHKLRHRAIFQVEMDVKGLNGTKVLPVLAMNRWVVNDSHRPRTLCFCFAS